MASLKKPVSCFNCTSVEMNHLFKPEVWSCAKCNTVLASRPQRNKHGICRECGKEANVPKKNLCKECRDKYQKEYVEKNYDRLRQTHKLSYQRDKEKRKSAVYKSIQRSYEGLLTHRIGRLHSKNGRYGTGVRVMVDIDLPYVMELLKNQDNKCALTKMPLTHNFKEMTCVSIDRIDSSKGYLKGNVQLVCASINFMKNSWLQEQAIDFIQQIVKPRECAMVIQEPIEKDWNLLSVTEKIHMPYEERKELIQQSFGSLLSERIRMIKIPSAKETGKSGQRMNVDIDLSYVMELLKNQSNKCAVTNIELTHKNNDMTCVSIDRIDSSKGYLKGNVQLVCAAVNFMKRSWTQEQVIDFLNQMRLFNSCNHAC